MTLRWGSICWDMTLSQSNRVQPLKTQLSGLFGKYDVTSVGLHTAHHPISFTEQDLPGPLNLGHNSPMTSATAAGFQSRWVQHRETKKKNAGAQAAVSQKTSAVTSWKQMLHSSSRIALIHVTDFCKLRELVKDYLISKIKDPVNKDKIHCVQERSIII